MLSPLDSTSNTVFSFATNIVILSLTSMIRYSIKLVKKSVRNNVQYSNQEFIDVSDFNLNFNFVITLIISISTMILNGHMFTEKMPIFVKLLIKFYVATMIELCTGFFICLFFLNSVDRDTFARKVVRACKKLFIIILVLMTISYYIYIKQ